ncbi:MULTISPECIES: hypothetical protein [unclassified Streptomyces]|uniref:hypothetical protein n=1 Tax=unclassified Streptomyces TaxID=2593676 RepID=UPI002E80D8DE|nr:hypothetical protein [Streptomyces sp. NBC_00589]WTI37754.1 hypothetical protein OIC96_23485 [Streptomyces sp. NBC_00775]WUB28567.1 hypothetical protein OHA51_26250 [Streptomyces sp. NBC_00589]
MRGRSKAATVATIAGAVALVALQGCGTETGGQNVADVHTRSSKPAHPAKPKAPTVCVGKQPVGSLPGPKHGDPDGTPLYRVMAYVEKRAEKHYRTVYTGLSVDQAHQATDVYRIPSEAFDADVCGAAEKGVTVRLHDTDINEKDLTALSDRISADMNRWDGTFELREVGPDVRGFVFVGVDDPAKARPVIAKAFGKKHIRVRHVGPASAASGG